MLLPEIALELKTQASLTKNKRNFKTKVHFLLDASSFTGGINVINIPLQLCISKYPCGV